MRYAVSALLTAAAVVVSYLWPEAAGTVLLAAAPTVPDAGSVAKKWAARVGGAIEDYKRGAAASGGKWAANTARSGANWKAGLTEAMAKDRFTAGVQKAGESAYTKGVTDKGGDRFAQGAMVSETRMAAGIAPVLQVISSVQLAERGPKGSPQNYTRSAAIGQALRQARTGR